MMRVLLAEDDRDIRVLTRMLLELAGHDVLEAGTASDAVASLDTDDAIDVLLLDLRLPDATGWEVMGRLGDSGRIDGLRVIVFSAQFDAPDHDRARRCGAAGYLTKPFTEDELLAAVTGG